MADHSWPLSWRFESQPDVLSQLDLLGKQEDGELRAWIRTQTPAACNFAVQGAVRFDMEHCREEDGIAFLYGLGLDHDDICTVVWVGPFPSVRMPIRVCLTYFYDVWYPGSDDIWVMDHARTWLFQCDHHGYLQFVHL